MDSMREAKMLLPMEKLIVQILEEKKNSIIQQVKHQIDLFDHHLASKFLLEGIPPPPWLFPNHPSLSSTELQKENIISGLLLPRANLYSSTQFSEKESSVDNAVLPTSLCTEVCGEKESVCAKMLLPMEKLIVQILEEKKNSIIQQVKHQIDLFDHHLASKCLLEGIPPPPWLFPNHPSPSSTELQKEDIISGLLIPRANLYSSTQFSEKESSVDNAVLPTSLCTEVCGEKESVCVKMLLPMEKLIVQILEEKKNSIIQQVKHQIDLFDHHLASKCLLEGIPPPPWLFPNHPSLSSTELQKEDIISGLLLPRANLYSSTQFSEKESSVDNAVLPTSLCTEVCGEKESVCVDRLSVLPQLGTSGALCVLNGVMEMDVSVASPQVCWDEGVLEMSDADHARSLARIQRSKSRHRALELRCSAKRTKMCPRDASDPGISGHQTLVPDGVTLQFGSTYGLELINAVEASNRICVAEVEKLGECSGKDYCADDFKCKKHDTSINTSELMRVRSSVPLPNSVKELSDVNNSSCFAMEKNRITESINRSVLPRTPSI